MGEEIPESLNGKIRNELLNGEIFGTILEGIVLNEKWQYGLDKSRPDQ